MADITVIKQNAAERVAVNPAPVTVTGVTLVPANNTTLGGIIVGDNLSITGNGVLSVADTFQPKTSCVTYGLTDTLLPSGPNKFYVIGEHAVQSGRNFYTGLRGRKTSGGTYLTTPITYGVGGYSVDANGTPTALSSIETSGSVIILSSAQLTSPISASTATLNSLDGSLTLATSNGVTGGSCSVFLDDGTVTISAGASGARTQLVGSNGTAGVSFNDYTFKVGSDSFSKAVSIKRQSLVSSVAFIYSVSNATAAFSFDSGVFFYDGDPLSSATELQHKYTNTFTNLTSSTKIRLVRNNAELSYAEVIQVKTPDSILTQGYADTRYQAVGAYLTSANLTFANITGTPITLAGYGITDGLTSANLTPYLTISSANATYAVLGHTHTIANVTGLQAALDAKLPSANFTYANITGTPNLTLYLTTANATAIYQPLGNYATTSCLTFANLTGKPTTLSGYGITDGYSTSNPSGYITAGANSFTGAQNLQDNELFRAKLRDYSETVSSPTISAGTLVLNLETSNIFTVSLNAAITTPIAITNVPASGSGASFTLIFTADGTPRSVSWPTSIKWAGGTPPTITSAIGKADSFAFFSSDGGATWQGYVGGQNF